MMELPFVKFARLMIVSVPPSCADKVNEQSAIHNRIAVHTFFVIFIEIRFYIVLIAAKIDVFFD